MITDEDIRWVSHESHDYKWDNDNVSRAEWQRRNDDVVVRMLGAKALLTAVQDMRAAKAAGAK